MPLLISPRARADYQLARAYVTRDPCERRLFAEFESSQRTFRLTINSRGDDHFDPVTGTIAWDPYSALRTTRGGTQSPALGLAHEIAHAIENPLREARLSARTNARYDDAEEARVIRGSERHAARELGEGVRFDHRGTLYRVRTPVSR
jgi:hypothetical protein